MIVRCAALLLLLAGCEWPVMSLGQRAYDAGRDARADADADAEGDEDFKVCSQAADCPKPSEPDEALCDLARGVCVECLRDDDCRPGETCDADGECDD